MASIGLSMIARGAEKTLAACLDSIKDYADPIVIALAGKPIDDTEGIARKYTPHVFQFEGEQLPDGGTANFAAARQASLDYLAKLTGPDHWWLWLDADDTVDGAEHFPAILQQAQVKKSTGVWLPYMYAFLADGTCTTLFDRERLFHDPTAFQWRNRVHEVIVPNAPVRWTHARQIVIRHNHTAGGSRSNRNLSLLHLMREEDPGDKRVLFYLGHQHFANGEWAQSVEWYEKYVAVADNKLEQWQAYLYMAKALRKLERHEQAMAAGLAALGMFPEWRDSWYDVAETYAYQQEWDRCLLLAAIGHDREPSSQLVFTNPLDTVGWNVGLFEEVAHFQLGHLDEALAKVKALQDVTNNDFLASKRQAYEEFVRCKDKGEAWLGILDGQPAERVAELAPSIPSKLLSIPEVRDAVHAARFTVHRRQKLTGQRVAFFCGPSLEAWGPPLINAGGIGGSETACIEIARRFRLDGWQVDVFNDCGKYEGEHEGVNYWQHQRFNKVDPYDLIVAWRQPQFSRETLNTSHLWFWAHDLQYAERLTAESAAGFERILGVSRYHTDYLLMVYQEFLNPARVDFVPNGINLERFQHPDITRQRHKLIWSSSPDRGLDVLLSMWPHVREALPDAELHVCYGFNNIEKMAKNVSGYRLFLEQMRRHMDKPGVIERGRLGQAELAQEMCSASVWAYPTSFCETACITAMEAMAAGMALITVNAGALPETVGEAGIIVPGHARQDAVMNKFLGNLFALLLDDATWEEFHRKGLARAPQFTWDKAYEKWREVWTKVT